VGKREEQRFPDWAMSALSRRVLVTGGAGFIGSHLVKRLLERGLRVTILDDLSTGSLNNLAEANAAQFVKGEITDSSLTGKLLSDVDAVIHLAAMVDHETCLQNPALAREVNVIGTRILLEEARRCDVQRFVYASSAAVYGHAVKLPIREDSALAPISPYGVSKAEAEQQCLEYAQTYGMRAICLRFFNVFGPRQTARQYSGVITEFMKNLRDGKPPLIYGDGLQTRDFVNVQDVVEAILLATDSETAVRVFNVATGIETTIEDLAMKLISIASQGSKPIYGPPRTGDIQRSVGDISKAKEKLGYSPRTDLVKNLPGLWNWYVGSGKTRMG
jgi:UDP-glucose 4-epimerase